MSDSRASIFRALRKNLPQVAPLPALAQAWTQYDDVVAQFGDSVLAVGGQIEGCCEADLTATIAGVPAYDDSKKIVSVIDSVPGNTRLDEVDDPHDLEDVHLAIGRGHFGVAENGAVWLDDRDLRHRVIMFLAQHVILVIRIDDIVNNMHEAYSRLSFDENHFGVFMSGPSKTADIEQSLVIGAHGARSLHVILVD
jgi:L-lactate dehydrogenase complex protein LldG